MPWERTRCNEGLLITDCLLSCEYSWGWTESCKTRRVSHPWLNDLLWLYIYGGPCPLFCYYVSAVKPSEFKYSSSNRGLLGEKLFKVSSAACRISIPLENNHSASMPLMPLTAFHTLFVIKCLKQKRCLKTNSVSF